MPKEASSYGLCKLLGIDYPILMAPMFLVSNTKMVVAALENGITAALPALNFRTPTDFRNAVATIRQSTQKPFGINLIVNKSNYKYHDHLDLCIELKVDFIITSLGNPVEVINRCKPLGIKVFCDVVDLAYAIKVADLGADAVIAVNASAGGHAGHLSQGELIPLLKQHLTIPIISAGGVGTGNQVDEALRLGAGGVSIGTLFIASEEAPVSLDYKKALIDYSAQDIILTTKISGTALTVINTPYFQSLSKDKSWLERMSSNKWLKKYAKLLLLLRGFKRLQKSDQKPDYQSVWCAGPAIQYIHAIRPVRQIITQLIAESSIFSLRN